MFFRYNGGVDGDFDTPGNWEDANGTDYTANYPNDTAGRLDDVVLDSVAVNALAGFTVTNKLNSLRITTGYKKADGTALDVGSSGTYLTLLANEVIAESFGNVFLEGASATGLESVRINGAESGKKVFLDGVLGNVHIDDDTVEIGAGATISGALTFGGGANTSPDVTILTGVTLPSTVQMRAGEVSCQSAVTTLEVFGGTWSQDAGDITTLRNYLGTTNWNAGNITTVECYGGSVLATDAINTQRVTTVKSYGGTVDLRNGLGNIRIADYIDYQGGTVLVDSGREFAEHLTETYAGSSDAKLGVSAQSVAAAASVWGDDVYVGLYDRLEVLVNVGDTDATTVTAQLYKSSTTAHSDEAAITDPAAITWDSTDDDKTKKLTLNGYQLTDGKTSIRLKISVAGGTAALVCAVYQVFRDY